MTKKKFLQKNKLSDNQFCGIEPIKGKCVPYDEKVKENGMYIESYPSKSVPEGFSPVVEKHLNIGDIKKTPRDFSPIVGEHLSLSSATKLPGNFSPIVMGSLDLSSLKNIPKGFNPVVGENLYLSEEVVLPNGFDPNVVGFVYRGQKKIDMLGQKDESILKSKDGKYEKVDGVFVEVLYRKKDLLKVKFIHHDKAFYVATDCGKKFATGSTIKKARSNYAFKFGKNKPKVREKFDKTIPKIGDEMVVFAEEIGIVECVVTDLKMMPKDKKKNIFWDNPNYIVACKSKRQVKHSEPYHNKHGFTSSRWVEKVVYFRFYSQQVNSGFGWNININTVSRQMISSGLLFSHEGFLKWKSQIVSKWRSIVEATKDIDEYEMSYHKINDLRQRI